MKKKLVVVFLALMLLAAGKSFAGEMSDIAKEIQVNGFVSAGYNWNFNDPVTRAINFRPFNDRHNSFELEVAELVFQKVADEKGEVGFRADLTYGFTVPEATRSTGLSLESDQFDLQQAFVRWVAPVGSGLTLDFGKFITEMGAEVIEGYDGWNYNYSRSLLFYFTIPFTHTGLRGAYTVNDNLTLMAQVINGWDNVVDNNNAKTFCFHAAVTPFEGTLVNLKYIVGAEQASNDSNLRQVFDLNLTQAIGQFTFNIDAVYGTEDEASAVLAGDDATWHGVAGIVRYALSDTVAFNLRGEYLRDEDGARTGTAQTMWEVTVTPEFTVANNLVIRPEYRHDASNMKVFDDGPVSGDSKTQDTLGVNFLFYF